MRRPSSHDVVGVPTTCFHTFSHSPEPVSSPPGPWSGIDRSQPSAVHRDLPRLDRNLSRKNAMDTTNECQPRSVQRVHAGARASTSHRRLHLPRETLACMPESVRTAHEARARDVEPCTCRTEGRQGRDDVATPALRRVERLLLRPRVLAQPPPSPPFLPRPSSSTSSVPHAPWLASTVRRTTTQSGAFAARPLDNDGCAQGNGATKAAAEAAAAARFDVAGGTGRFRRRRRIGNVRR